MGIMAGSTIEQATFPMCQSLATGVIEWQGAVDPAIQHPAKGMPMTRDGMFCGLTTLAVALTTQGLNGPALFFRRITPQNRPRRVVWLVTVAARRGWCLTMRAREVDFHMR